MTPGVARREWAAFLVSGGRADEALASTAGQGVHGAVEAALCERLRLSAPRAEAGAPKQSLGLFRTERTPVDGNFGCGLRQKT